MSKKYEKLLQEIAEKKCKYSESMQPGCQNQQIAKLQKNTLENLSAELPNEYIDFLCITDGLDWNGLLIYASETSPIIGYKDRSIPGFLETNLLNRDEDESCKDLLFFGCSGIDAYVLKVSTEEYQILDRVSLDITETFPSFDALIFEALKSHL